jgi:putative phosphoribosyl transferase
MNGAFARRRIGTPAKNNTQRLPADTPAVVWTTEALTVITDQPLREEQSVLVRAGALGLQGKLVVPDDALAVVMSIDETGDCQLQSFHRVVASKLNDAGIATLLFDLLTPNEQADARVAANCRNDIQLLASRVATATDWLSDGARIGCLPVGYFGTGVGSAAALAAAAERPAVVSAIVSSSGRPLLVRPALPQVRAPTLLITLGSNGALVKLNRAAFSQMLCKKCLELVPDLRDESDLQDEVARLALDWFAQHLVANTELGG